MAFNFFKWILHAASPGADEQTGGLDLVSTDFLDGGGLDAVAGLEIYLQRMAFWSCVRKIGHAVGACEIQTVRAGRKAKAREYWSWNYEPNPNQTRSQFMSKLIGNLYLHQEALVVETSQGFRYVADAWSVEKQLTGNIYRDVTVDGQSVPGVFAAKDVLYFSIEGDKIKKLLMGLATAEGRLMRSTASSILRSNGMRGTLEIDDFAEADPDFEDNYADLVNDKFKAYFTAENAVLPLFKGYHYTERQGASGQTSTRDIRAMMDDITEYTARAIGIPASIALGSNVSDADFKEFMTSTVQPLVNMITQEINRKIYGQRQVLQQQTYVVIDYAGVRYTDLFDVANPIDKLIGSGAFCINDVRVRLGLDPIDEAWASQHWMTKNYSTVEDLNTPTDGGNNTSTTPAKEPGEGDNDEN